MDWAQLVAKRPPRPTVIAGVCIETSFAEQRSTGQYRQPAACSGDAQLAPKTQPNLREWDPETAKLISWFMGTKPPSGHFELQQAVTIAHPSRYWEYVRGDINAGPRRGRGKTGALQDDLRRLHQLFGSK